MSNSTTLLDTIDQGQGQKELTANNLFNAMSPASFFANRSNTTGGLYWGYYGGFYFLAGLLTAIASGTVLLTASSTNYIELNLSTGAISANTTGFTAGRLPLYTAVTNTTDITTWTDYRSMVQQRLTVNQRLVLAMANANKTLTNDQAACDIIELTGALTAKRDVIVPLVPRQWTFYANTTGAFGIRVIGASGTGIDIADTKRAILYCDGTNVVRVTADT